MAGTRDTHNGRLKRKLKTLKKMKAKAAAKRAEMFRLGEETTEIIAAMEEKKFELELLKMSLHQQSEDMLFISEIVDNITDIML
ncbi:hypothetical protein SLEP1_g34073 [Rubroshorea leprosula]|uniref:Uncharacterized protein n=1 Tax=Rubroshorea leprosula TaxID=152421 RepID=A0AAV5KIN6_9ROSI|nr:hypothetical protein SLEP1_g34073 [Rubroshorea leprosula]